MERKNLAKFFWDAMPRTPFMGPPLPEGLDVWWPDFMLAGRPGLITDLNLQLLKIRRGVTNAIAGTELIPGEPYPKKPW